VRDVGEARLPTGSRTRAHPSLQPASPSAPPVRPSAVANGVRIPRARISPSSGLAQRSPRAQSSASLSRAASLDGSGPRALCGPPGKGAPPSGATCAARDAPGPSASGSAQNRGLTVSPCGQVSKPCFRHDSQRRPPRDVSLRTAHLVPCPPYLRPRSHRRVAHCRGSASAKRLPAAIGARLQPDAVRALGTCAGLQRLNALSRPNGMTKLKMPSSHTWDSDMHLYARRLCQLPADPAHRFALSADGSSTRTWSATRGTCLAFSSKH
jgi:hypothetical protein